MPCNSLQNQSTKNRSFSKEIKLYSYTGLIIHGNFSMKKMTNWVHSSEDFKIYGIFLGIKEVNKCQKMVLIGTDKLIIVSKVP